MTGHHPVEALRPYAEDGETTILIDGGNIGQWAHQVLADRYPERWLTCGASGVVGWGIAGAMGARLARPDGRVISLTGDGAAHYGLAELEAAVRQDLPFVAILADDRAWGIVVTEQNAQFGEEGVTASLIREVACAGLATAYGARGAITETLAELRWELDRSLRLPSPTIIHAPILTGGHLPMQRWALGFAVGAPAARPWTPECSSKPPSPTIMHAPILSGGPPETIAPAVATGR